jgi:hypothetical protein
MQEDFWQGSKQGKGDGGIGKIFPYFNKIVIFPLSLSSDQHIIQLFTIN